MNKLYLIIGIPGSGKTTKAKEIINTYNAKNIPINHYEADMYFEHNGKYIFDRSKLAEAHKWCQDKCRESMIHNIDIIISNTSLTPRERSTYIRMSKIYGYELIVLTMTGNYQNIHDVPNEALQNMRNRYIPFSKEELIN